MMCNLFLMFVLLLIHLTCLSIIYRVEIALDCGKQPVALNRSGFEVNRNSGPVWLWVFNNSVRSRRHPIRFGFKSGTGFGNRIRALPPICH
ncbi:hypothetical protein POJ06DRAFT_251087 [Lipomyces tetrasporus]|uniref:Secreted protein n=1 Tax=Lipomyces tetrasporus TaxID=54092 RepID=A0AAD7QTM8_9ASCO|nr:uncharacterized protein POJ06DRAFT_251087 [Lipomyces tetrasporus]KAJ8101293.1 hypothetical protein POJ06DRAFT_251087 [Lipomyces tetrasporus]